MDFREERSCYCHSFGSEPLRIYLLFFNEVEGVPFVGILWEEVSLDTFRW